MDPGRIPRIFWLSLAMEGLRCRFYESCNGTVTLQLHRCLPPEEVDHAIRRRILIGEHSPSVPTLSATGSLRPLRPGFSAGQDVGEAFQACQNDVRRQLGPDVERHVGCARGRQARPPPGGLGHAANRQGAFRASFIISTHRAIAGCRVSTPEPYQMGRQRPDRTLGDNTEGACDPTGKVSPNVAWFRWQNLARHPSMMVGPETDGLRLLLCPPRSTQSHAERCLRQLHS
jgi:hypothetical protein